MADVGSWRVCESKPIETIFRSLSPNQEPLVIYRIQSNGPCAVTADAAVSPIPSDLVIDPGTDCDVSSTGARLIVRLEGLADRVDGLVETEGTREGDKIDRGKGGHRRAEGGATDSRPFASAVLWGKGPNRPCARFDG